MKMKPCRYCGTATEVVPGYPPPQQQTELLRPREFQRRNVNVFPSLPALYYHLSKRRVNGMLKSGLVIEAPTGTLLLDPNVLERWLRGQRSAA